MVENRITVLNCDHYGKADCDVKTSDTDGEWTHTHSGSQHCSCCLCSGHATCQRPSAQVQEQLLVVRSQPPVGHCCSHESRPVALISQQHYRVPRGTYVLPFDTQAPQFTSTHCTLQDPSYCGYGHLLGVGMDQDNIPESSGYGATNAHEPEGFTYVNNPNRRYTERTDDADWGYDYTYDCMPSHTHDHGRVGQ
jgi:hypothetical protein